MRKEENSKEEIYGDISSLISFVSLVETVIFLVDNNRHP